MRRSSNFYHKSAAIVKRALKDRIYYFNRFGKVDHFHAAYIDTDGVYYKSYKISYRFAWSEYRVFWFFDEAECKKKAQEYIKRLRMPLSKFKRIFNYLKKNKNGWVYGLASKFYTDAYDTGYVEISDDLAYDKFTQTFSFGFDYDDDWGGGTYYQDMPISQYGKTWAIYLKDLPAKIRKKVEEYGD